MAGWLVGNCDFNENPVVHLDLDFDLGFVNFWVRQVSDFKAKFNNNFFSLSIRSPTPVYVRTYSTYGETDNV